MHEFEQLEDGGTDTVFRDVIMLTLAGFIVIVLLLLPHINPVAKTEQVAEPPGNVIVELHWPDELDADVDLWVEAPGDTPVGYSNQGGLVFNLLRDDLGQVSDPLKINYETAYSRGLPAGEYTVNVHLYRNRTEHYPVPARISAKVTRPGHKAPIHIATADVEITVEGEEITVFRFTIDDDGGLVADSVHALQRDLRGDPG